MNLLYYNSNVTTRLSNDDFPGVEKFSKFFQLFHPTAAIIDRTNTIKIPFHVKSLFPIPLFKPMKKTFEEICNERACELLTRADKLGVTLYVFYSGGIDSTLLLVSLLKNAALDQKFNIVVLLNEESITENPSFYRDHIYGKLRADSANIFPYLLGSRHMLVGGEHNDQLHGYSIMEKLIFKFGSSIIHQPYKRDNFFKFFNEILNDKESTNFYLDLFERLKATAPVPVVTHFDYLWWISFSSTWQLVFTHLLNYTAPRNISHIDAQYIGTNYNQFYGTDDFQLWSLNNLDKRIKDTWKTYKWVCKDIVYDYTKDADYRDNKIKRASLYSLLEQQHSYNFIDDSLRFWSELDPQEYYNPDNDFID